MSERDQMLDELSGGPEDWKIRSVLADWCEDNHRPEEAACLRWMIRHRKRPWYRSPPKATWFNGDKVNPELGDPESDIPEPLYQELEGGKQTAHHMTFDSLRAAEEAILAAWARARRAGWNPGE